MSTTTPHPPLPKQPLGRTFLVAISLLGLFAVLQLLAVVWHYIPTVRQQIANSAVPVAPEPTQQPYRPQPASQAPSQAASTPLDSATFLKAQNLMSEADRRLRVEGDFDEALVLLDQADALLPGDPKILSAKAQVLERLDRPADAVAALTQVLRYPGLPSQMRVQVERKMAQLSQLIADNPGSAGATLTDTNPEDALRENGIQPGASLGIVDVKLKDTKVGEKGLRLAVKSRPGSTINVKDVKILVYFYEETEDGIQLTESPVGSQWQSQPIDWAADEPELVEMKYTMPPADANNGSARKYYGYVVGIYYQGVLQDFRSDPAKLARDFPLPLDLKQAP